MFTLEDFNLQGFKGVIEAFKNQIDIEADVLEKIYYSFKDYEIDTYFVDFEESGRWDISQAIIYQFDTNGDFFRIWRNVGLTEMQENYFDTQIPEKVKEGKITRRWWYKK